MSTNELELAESLVISETANRAFDSLLSEIADLMECASLYRSRQMVDPFAMNEFVGKLELTIEASGFDSRIIRMCQVMLSLTGVSEQEFAVDNSGKILRRKVYFAKRSDGIIKIGSAMNVSRRLGQLKTGAAEDLELIGFIDGSTDLEKHIHAELSQYAKHGEWFYQSPEVMACIARLLASQGKSIAGVKQA